MAGKDDISAAKKPKTESTDLKSMSNKHYLDQVNLLLCMKKKTSSGSCRHVNRPPTVLTQPNTRPTPPTVLV